MGVILEVSFSEKELSQLTGFVEHSQNMIVAGRQAKHYAMRVGFTPGTVETVLNGDVITVRVFVIDDKGVECE